MPSENENGPKPCLLVVDDSRLMRVAARKILKSDFDILEAADGEAAWEQLQKNTDIALVMSDLSMPNLDGLGLLKKIREADDETLRRLPVIIVTGAEDDDGSKQSALSAGASDFITKPFDSVQLLARTKAQARQRHTDQALRETEQAKQQLEEHVSIDPLTGLANEYALKERGEENLAYAIRHGSEVALLCLRIDRFKILFLRRGKAAAEELVCQLARLLGEDRRREDTVARIGLAEFALLLPSANPPGVQRIAERLRQRIEAHSFEVDGETLQVTASIGLSCPPVDEDTRFSSLLDEARLHLAEAEKSGGNRVAADTARLAPASPPTSEDTPAAASPAQVKRALQALAQGTTPEEDSAALLMAVLPLLEYCDKNNRQRLKQHIEAIRRSLSDRQVEADEAAPPVLPTEVV